MAEKSPTVQPTRQRRVFTAALLHTGLDDQKPICVVEEGDVADVADGHGGFP
jgi:hypothetical protein